MPVSQALLAEEIRGPFEIISLSGELVYLFRGGQLWSKLIRRNPVTQRFQRVVGNLYGSRRWQMPLESNTHSNRSQVVLVGQYPPESFPSRDKVH